MGEAIETNTFLKKLNIEAIQIVVLFVHFCTDIIYNEIGDEGAKAIGKALKKNISLTDIKLMGKQNNQTNNYIFYLR